MNVQWTAVRYVEWATHCVIIYVEQWLTPSPFWANSFVESSTHCMAGVGRGGAVKVALSSGVTPGTEIKTIKASKRGIIFYVVLSTDEAEPVTRR